MTVKELKEYLSHYSDDAEVNDNNEILWSYSGSDITLEQVKEKIKNTKQTIKCV